MSLVVIKSGGIETEKTDWPEVVRRQVGSLSYGVVQIMVHDSQVRRLKKRTGAVGRAVENLKLERGTRKLGGRLTTDRNIGSNVRLKLNQTNEIE